MPDEDDAQPITRADLKTELNRSGATITEAIDAAITATGADLTAAIAAAEQRAGERARDMQTEILRRVITNLTNQRQFAKTEDSGEGEH